VCRPDRLARSIGDLKDIVRAVRAKAASLNATEQPIDTGTAAGKCFLDMLGVFAEFETNLRRERQLEGDRQGQGGQRLQGPAGFDRRHPGTRNEGALQRYREGPQDRAGIGLSGTGHRSGDIVRRGTRASASGGVSPAPSFVSINPT
jgi:DNA invertase Pin-like site-specific DNA recombinase